MKLLLMLLSLNAYAHSPSVIIGPTTDWVDVETLDKNSMEYKRSQLVGQLVTDRNTKCTGFVHPVDGEVYTNEHCFGKMKWATFYWDGEEYELTKWYCDKLKDYCKTLTFEVSDDRTYPYEFHTHNLPRRGYIIHRQSNKTVISRCEILTDPSFPWKFIEYGEGCDTFFGSSGGAVYDAETHELIGIHHSGNKDKQENYGSYL